MRDFGAFVETLPGTDGLVHISQLAAERVQRVSDVLNQGDQVMVKVLQVDRLGKIRLSRKDALQDLQHKEFDNVPSNPRGDSISEPRHSEEQL